MNIDKSLKRMLGNKKIGKVNFGNNIMKNFRLKSFGGKKDWDFDGVPNWKDCQPKNTMRQHWSGRTGVPISDYPKSYGFSKIVKQMKPQEFLEITRQEVGRRVSDVSKKEKKEYEYIFDPEIYEDVVIHKPTVQKLIPPLKSKKPLMDEPWVEMRKGIPVSHEGRHRAVAARELSMKTIPVHFVETEPGWNDKDRKIDNDNESKDFGWHKKDKYIPITGKEYQTKAKVLSPEYLQPYGEVTTVPGRTVGRGITMAGVVVPGAIPLPLAAGVGGFISSKVENVKLIKTDAQDRPYKIPRLQVHFKSKDRGWGDDIKEDNQSRDYKSNNSNIRCSVYNIYNAKLKRHINKDVFKKYKVKIVGSHSLDDYGGMNYYASKHLKLRFVPNKNEILVEKDNKKMMASTILHEITEAELMKKGISYNTAHKKSVNVELKAGIVPRKIIIESNKDLFRKKEYKKAYENNNIREDRRSRNQSDVFKYHLFQKGINVSLLSPQEQKRTYKEFRKRPELIEKAKEMMFASTRYTDVNYPFYTPAIESEKVKPVLGEEAIFLSPELFKEKRKYIPPKFLPAKERRLKIDPKGAGLGRSIAHELEHRKQHQMLSEEELQRQRLEIIRRQEEEEKAVKQEKILQATPEKKLEFARKWYLKGRDKQEIEAIQTGFKSRERDISVPEEKRMKAFRGVFKDEQVKIDDIKEDNQSRDFDDMDDVVESVLMHPEKTLRQFKEGTRTAKERKIKQYEAVRQHPVELTTTPMQMHRVIVAQRELAHPREFKIHLAESALGTDEYNLRQQISHQKYGRDWIDLTTKEKNKIRQERIDKHGYYRPIADEQSRDFIQNDILRKITRKGSDITIRQGVSPITLMNTVIANDSVIKQLQRVQDIHRNDDWFIQWNTEARRALKEQGYTDDDIDSYLSQRSRAMENMASNIMRRMGL